MRASARARRVAAAREAFLSSGSARPAAAAAVDDTILTSWQRSQMAGVRIDVPEVPYYEDVDPRSRLARCAAPVLDRLHDRLDDIPVSIVLTDAQGRIIVRRDEERRLGRRFDTVSFAPGFSYAETHVGTNGVGTALETGTAVLVTGPEHFNEQSTAFACAGAPIRDPLSRRIEGLIDLSCLAGDAHPMMRALVQEAARDVERLLLEDGSERQQMVLQEFLAACRRRAGAVLSVAGDVVMANKEASVLLTPADSALLRMTAADTRRLDPGTTIEMSLADGRSAEVRCRPVARGRELAGTVFEVLPRDAHPSRSRRSRRPARVALPGLAGRDPAWLDACGQVRAAARRRASLLISGEDGTGKLAVARAALQDVHQAAAPTIIDCAEPDPLAAVHAASGQALVLRHLDRLPPEDADALAAVLDAASRRGPAPWLVGTARAGADLPEVLLQLFTTSVTLPPLRHRMDDLPDLAAALLNRLAPGRGSALAPDTERVLTRLAWPGNVGELAEVLRAALRRRRVGPIRRDDLPAGCFTTSRRALTPLEALERDAIVAALVETDGNRTRAAERLGMSRSSLYRKIHTYGIEPVDPTG
ncbi:sigma-54-dependent Fis family transcriptional regulator [Pseudonocardia thermophila]|uniref:sigma-54-dependent Fis family transcriptional regulator n=1 Tax=Pseudonocardia thermophila TaxID=1848 RepID=UPI00248E041D|nr:helix-turn-helix domain-containing protein [Pseudonocardia thermophila]